MLSACFCHSRSSQVEYNCTLLKVGWIAACIAQTVIGAVLVIFLQRCLNSPRANGKQGPIPEEMSQTLLTNKKQGNLDKVYAIT
jgi:hypothetical protein